MRALGARVERVVERAERRGAGAWDVHGVGVAGFREPREVLDFGNSATGCRLVMGAVAGCPITATFDGDASLRKRPMRRILDPVELMGAHTVHASEGGRLPITIAGARATPCPSSTARRSLRRTSNRPCARRPRCAGRDDRRRKRGKPRSHRTPARPFRRAHHVPAGTMAVVRSPDFLRVLNQRDCACNIDPPASSYAIMRRAGPYRGENSGPGKEALASTAEGAPVCRAPNALRASHCRLQHTRPHASPRAGHQKQTIRNRKIPDAQKSDYRNPLCLLLRARYERATWPPRRRAWLRIFVVRCGLPCEAQTCSGCRDQGRLRTPSPRRWPRCARLVRENFFRSTSRQHRRSAPFS